VRLKQWIIHTILMSSRDWRDWVWMTHKFNQQMLEAELSCNISKILRVELKVSGLLSLVIHQQIFIRSICQLRNLRMRNTSQSSSLMILIIWWLPMKEIFTSTVLNSTTWCFHLSIEIWKNWRNFLLNRMSTLRSSSKRPF
jgi:hypothetical protein